MSSHSFRHYLRITWYLQTYTHPSLHLKEWWHSRREWCHIRQYMWRHAKTVWRHNMKVWRHQSFQSILRVSGSLQCHRWMIGIHGAVLYLGRKERGQRGRKCLASQWVELRLGEELFIPISQSPLTIAARIQMISLSATPAHRKVQVRQYKQTIVNYSWN